jgi:aerotaxis receptor
MRNNQPVNDREFRFAEDASLVSTTDLQGRILYCNPAFIEASGFAREELLGQPHNMIRHPDMPPEAFEDMWRTIAGGSPWTGLVKNRRKDGGFYWVLANVTPLMRGAGPVGYLSVRTSPAREAVDAAARLYARMRDVPDAGRRGWGLRNGIVRPTGRLAGAAAALRGALPLRTVVTAGLLAGAGWAGHMIGGPAGVALPLAATVAAVRLLRSQSGGALQAVVAPVNRMAAGDLSPHADEGAAAMPPAIARALGQVNVNLRAIVGDARREVENMRIATREIAAGNADLASRTESQAANVEQTAATMEEITGAVRQSAESARRATLLAAQANELTRTGRDSVAEMTRAIHQIAESSARIGQFIQVIDGVAFQTNILALNAAVEAARAGDSGRGFAVVATEVRALAGRTSQAALEAKTLIDQAAAIVAQGNEVSAAASARILEAARRVEEVHAVIDEISTGATEQLAGISQVNEAVTHLDTLTQQNSALVEQISAAALSLEAQAANVANAMEVFHLEDQPQAAADAVALRRAMKAVAPVPAGGAGA